jgi:hypothetical protein
LKNEIGWMDGWRGMYPKLHLQFEKGGNVAMEDVYHVKIVQKGERSDVESLVHWINVLGLLEPREIIVSYRRHAREAPRGAFTLSFLFRCHYYS